MQLIVRWLVIAAAVWLVADLVPGVSVTGGNGSYFIIAALFAVVNIVIGPVVRLISLPFTLLTLGLFLLVVNAALLGITAALTARLSVDGFGTAVVAGFLVGVACGRRVDGAVRCGRADGPHHRRDGGPGEEAVHS